MMDMAYTPEKEHAKPVTSSAPVTTREVRKFIGTSFLTFKNTTPQNEKHRQKPSTSNAERMRQKLGMWLDGLVVQTAIVVIVIIDIFLLIFLILMDQSIIVSPQSSSISSVSSLSSSSSSTSSSSSNVSTSSPSPSSTSSPDTVQEAETALHILNILILFIFFIEAVLRVIASGPFIFKDLWQVFDCLVSSVTLIFYLALTAAGVPRAATYSMGLLIILRLWRIKRIYSGICARERRKAERIINVHRKARSDAEEYTKVLQLKCEQQQAEIQRLLELLRGAQRSPVSPGGPRIEFHQKGDASVTSDEESEKSPGEKRSKVLHRAEISANQNVEKHVGNGSIPSGTPRGSLHSLQPGTPTSTDSSDMPSSPTSGKIGHGVPDLAEHPPSQGSEALPPAYFGIVERDPPDGAQDCHRHNSVRIGPDIEASLPAGSSARTAVNGTSSAAPPSGSQHHSVPLYTTANKRRDDRKRLLKVAPPIESMSYINESYEDGDVTQEEIQEIKRVSQVPFESTSCLNMEEVPMTDL